MNHRPSLFALGLGILMLSNLASAAEPAPEISLTVYSSASPGGLDVAAIAQSDATAVPGYALVRDRRHLSLPRGRGEVRFVDVAREIDPTTVSFASLDDPQGTRVLEQNYQFDLVSSAKLLDRYLGEKIEVEVFETGELQRHSGRLLGTAGALLLELDSGEVVSLGRWDLVRFPSLPGGLITRPTLVWLLESRRGGSQRVEVAYQTRGLTWWADYNAILSGSEASCEMQLSSWVTIVNRSGAGYPQAQLKLVAGEVQRHRPAAPRPHVRAFVADAMAAAEGFREEELYEYHLYTLGRRTDLPEASSKQLELFPAATRVPCRRELVFTASPFSSPLWGGAPNLDQGLGATHKGQAGAFVEFANRSEHGLGVPLPAGRIRFNQAAGDGSLEFIGEDTIGHTPRNETLRLRLGTSFDVVGERKRVDWQLESGRKELRETYEIEIRNRKQREVEVVVREYLFRWSQWEVVQSSQPFEKRDQQTIDFRLKIPADQAGKVRYTVRYRW